MNNLWTYLIFINHVMTMRGYHLPISRVMNFAIVNDITCCRSRYLMHQFSIPFYLNSSFYLHQSIRVKDT
ncbi:hypothetical protein F383_28201 [Gossypium arboreum]|uniref:Uncharacterized protein n=1 Tax=Gossypium arboreum TaxID=29729 RepID=A0A0B0MQJ4_GOSAR|nr:hypothetical protein F383_28201 [Gossypium arboreum]